MTRSRSRPRPWSLAPIAVLLCALPLSAQSGVVVQGSVTLDSGWAGEPLAGIAAGQRETLLLRSDGTVAAWGEVLHTVPTLPSGLTYVEVAAGGEDAWLAPPGQWIRTAFRVARRSDGSVIAWGDNSYGQCNVPALPSGLAYLEVTAGGMHALARRSDGSIVAWGRNWYGECDPPALPAGVTYVEVAAGGAGDHDYWATVGHSVARRSDGSVVAWGANSAGQCNVPPLPPGLTCVEVAAGEQHTLVRCSDGSVLAWGDNGSGQCNVPALPPGVTYVAIAAGENHSVALRSDGSAVGWGDNGASQCNVPALPAGRSYVEISAGRAHTVARRADGAVVAWGANESLQCNLPPCPFGVSYTDLAGGGYHYLPYPYTSLPRRFWVFLRSDGAVTALGDNSFGQCDVPPAPPGLTYVEIAAGAKHTLARLSDGTVIARGSSSSGQCDVPTPPLGVTYVEIAAGGQFYDTSIDPPGHSLGRLSDGTIVAWGPGPGPAPALPAGLVYTAIAAGGYHSLALRSDGSAIAWSDTGQLGVPALPSGLTYVEVAAGGYHSLALRSDGAVVAWGSNAKGQCDVPAPPPGTTYVEVAAGEQHSLARRSDGVADAWGDNTGAQCDLPALASGLACTGIAAGFRSSMLSYGPDCSFQRPYCSSGTSSNSCTPSISGAGSASGSAGAGFTLTVGALDGLRNGMIFYGVDNSGFVPPAWTDGSTSLLCVRPPLQRTQLQSSGGSPGACDGSLSIDWNAFVATHPWAPGAPFTTAVTVQAQGWFRDPLAPRDSNLSDALVFRVCP